MDSINFRKRPDVFVIKHHGQNLIYAPLKNRTLFVSKEELDLLENFTPNGTDSELEQVLTILGCFEAPNTQQRIHNYSKISSLTFLPNNKCNFSCSYCYSASSRDNAEISDSTIDLSLEYFISRSASDKFKIGILGGGEPFMSFNKIKHIINQSQFYAQKYNKTVSYTITTNASLITPKIIENLPSAPIQFLVSFDILPDIQNTNRQVNSYDKVFNGIQLLIKSGFFVGTNTIITPANVNRLTESIEHLNNILPQIKTCKFEPVITSNLPDNFFEEFLNSYFKAEETAKKYGIKLVTSYTKTLETISSRFCGGGISIAPNGDIMACPSVSSPYSDQPELYKLYKLGCIDTINKHVEVNWDKMQHIYSAIRIDENCESCFAKFACSGMCFHEALSRQTFRHLCNFKREYLYRLINE